MFAKSLEKSEDVKLKPNGLHRDHPPALTISYPASVGVKLLGNISKN